MLENIEISTVVVSASIGAVFAVLVNLLLHSYREWTLARRYCAAVSHELLGLTLRLDQHMNEARNYADLLEQFGSEEAVPLPFPEPSFSIEDMIVHRSNTDKIGFIPTETALNMMGCYDEIRELPNLYKKAPQMPFLLDKAEAVRFVLEKAESIHVISDLTWKELSELGHMSYQRMVWIFKIKGPTQDVLSNLSRRIKAMQGVNSTAGD